MSLQKSEISLPETAPVRRSSQAPWKRSLRRAERLTDQGEFAMAILALERARESGADPYLCLLRIAHLYRKLELWSNAIQAAEQAIHIAPGKLQGWEMVLELAQEAGDQQRAVTASQTLIKLSPRHIPAYTTLSEAYMKEGDIPAALRVSNTLIRLEPDAAAHHFNKALLCQHQNDIELAVHEFMQAIWLEPDGPYSDPARGFLEDLDVMQINQIITLALEDTIFRTKLARNCKEAVVEKGFVLSPVGEQILAQFCEETLPESPTPQRIALYH